MLDGFEESGAIISGQGAGGITMVLMFAIPAGDTQQVSERLESFVASASCEHSDGFANVRSTVSL